MHHRRSVLVRAVAALALLAPAAVGWAAEPVGAQEIPPAPTITAATTQPSVLVGIGVNLHVEVADDDVTNTFLAATLYGPDDPECDGPHVYDEPARALDGSGSYDFPYFPTTVHGAYRWDVQLLVGGGGDASVLREIACGAEGLTTEVVRAVPTMQLAASNATVGFPIAASATLSGPNTSPTGGLSSSLEFRLFADGSCEVQVGSTSTRLVTEPDHPVGSDTFTPTEPGIYLWQVTYLGNAHNAPVTSGCGDAVSYVTPVPPTLTGIASSPPSSVADTVTIVGGPEPPAGTLRFQLFPAGDVLCRELETPPVFEQSVVLAGGDGQSRTITVTDTTPPTTPGTYQWLVTYDWTPDLADDVVPPVVIPCLTQGQATVIPGVEEPTQLATELRVTPTLFQLRPFRFTGGRVSATLTADDEPVPGEPITFRFGGPSGAVICAATTSSDGVASCPRPSGFARFRLLFDTVHASYAGDDTYLPSTGSAGAFG